MKGIFKFLSKKSQYSGKNGIDTDLGHRLLATHIRVMTTAKTSYTLFR